MGAQASSTSSSPPALKKKGEAWLSPEGLIQRAVQCFDAQDHSAGFGYLAQLLSYRPGHTVWLGFIHSFAQLAGPQAVQGYIQQTNSLQKAPLVEVALGANLMTITDDKLQNHKNKKNNQAIYLLAQVHTADPSTQYHEAWILPRLETYLQEQQKQQTDAKDRPQEVSSMEATTYAMLVRLAFVAFPDSLNCTAQQRRMARRWYDVLSKLQPSAITSNEDLATILQGLQRKAGYLEESKRQAEDELKRNPTSLKALVQLSAVLRDTQDYEGLEATHKRMLEIQPDYAPAFLDAGDTFLEANMWDQALEWYHGLLQWVPNHLWALPSFFYCNYRKTGNDEWIEQCLAIAERDNNQRASMLLQRVIAKPNFPMDPTAQLLGRICMRLDQNPDMDDDTASQIIQSVKFDLDFLDAPSNTLAIHLEMNARGKDYLSSLIFKGISAQKIPEPDPRIPKATINSSYILWKYDDDDNNGMDSSPAVPPPSPFIINKIAHLASLEYNPQKVWVAASYVAEEVGHESLRDVLASMVHPPPIPSSSFGKKTLSIFWLPRVQSAAAAVIAQIYPDSAWETSVQRDAFYSLLFGPTDWITTEAITALATLVLNGGDKMMAHDVLQMFRELEQHLPKHGYCCYEEILFAKKKELELLWKNK